MRRTGIRLVALTAIVVCGLIYTGIGLLTMVLNARQSAGAD